MIKIDIYLCFMRFRMVVLIHIHKLSQGINQLRFYFQPYWCSLTPMLKLIQLSPLHSHHKSNQYPMGKCYMVSLHTRKQGYHLMIRKKSLPLIKL